MSKFRLFYFNLRGRAEPIRWIFAVAEKEYEDVRLDREKDWPNKKKDMPGGKVPVLYVDDKPLSQSVSICRYLGNTSNLGCEDAWMSAVGDEVADAVHDLLPPAAKILYARAAGDNEEAARLKKELDDVLVPTLKLLESKLKSNQWICGDKMTWVDVYVACYTSQLSQHNEEIFNSFQLVKDHYSRVVELPQIQKWLKKRPDTYL